MQYWNDQNSISDPTFQIMWCQVWQVFVEELIRTIASVKNIDLELKDNFAIKEVTGEAFSILGNTGTIETAKEHSCSQCSLGNVMGCPVVFQSNLCLCPWPQVQVFTGMGHGFHKTHRK